MNNQQRKVPYLEEGPREKYFILRWESDPDFYGELIEKWSDLKDADWLREDWHHDLNWRPNWELQMMLNREALVGKLLRENRVFPRTSMN